MNKDNYKNAVDQICASDKLKEKTLEKIKQRKTNKISYLKLLSSVAIIIIPRRKWRPDKRPIP